MQTESALFEHSSSCNGTCNSSTGSWPVSQSLGDLVLVMHVNNQGMAMTVCSFRDRLMVSHDLFSVIRMVAGCYLSFVWAVIGRRRVRCYGPRDLHH